MVLVGIMVSQPMLLLVGGDAGASERFVEPKLLECGFDLALRHGVVAGLGCSWCETGLTVACLWMTVRDPAA
jgi:hypothetical protein